MCVVDRSLASALKAAEFKQCLPRKAGAVTHGTGAQVTFVAGRRLAILARQRRAVLLRAAEQSSKPVILLTSEIRSNKLLKQQNHCELKGDAGSLVEARYHPSIGVNAPILVQPDKSNRLLLIQSG